MAAGCGRKPGWTKERRSGSRFLRPKNLQARREADAWRIRKQIIAPVVLNLNDAISETRKLLGRLIGEDIELVTVLDPDIGNVKADPGQIEQVIMNLAVNARDAMPGGGKLTLSTGNVVLDESYVKENPGSQAGPHVFLSLSDTGIGMDVETLPHLFEPFFTTKEQGRVRGSVFRRSTES